MLEVCHQVPGRLRLRVPGLLNDQRLAARLTASLGASPGVHAVRVNPACGSLVVRHDPALSPTRIGVLIESMLAPPQRPLQSLSATAVAAPALARLGGPVVLAPATGLGGVPERPAGWRRWLPWRRRGMEPGPFAPAPMLPLAPAGAFRLPEPARAVPARGSRCRRPAAPPLAYRVQFEMVRRVLSNSLECLWYDVRFGAPRAPVAELPAPQPVALDLFDRLLARPLGLDGVAVTALDRARRGHLTESTTTV